MNNMSVCCFLIDDDSDDQEIFMAALKEVDSSISCIFADSGSEALLKISSDESFVPDFIFLDLNMPGINGKQCLAEIKKYERLKVTPVVIYSTTVGDKDIQEVNHLGAAGHFTKPSSFSELCSILHDLIKENKYPSNNA